MVRGGDLRVLSGRRALARLLVRHRPVVGRPLPHVAWLGVGLAFSVRVGVGVGVRVRVRVRVGVGVRVRVGFAVGLECPRLAYHVVQTVAVLRPEGEHGRRACVRVRVRVGVRASTGAAPALGSGSGVGVGLGLEVGLGLGVG